MTGCILLLLAALIVPAPRTAPSLAQSGVPTADGDSRVPASSAAIVGQTSPVDSVGTPLQAVKGTASWYATSGPGIYAAAGPALRVGHWRGRTVEVCGNGSCVRVRLTDWCACPKRVIDMSADAFSRLAPLSRGLIHVRVTWGDSTPLPATDTE